MDRSHKTVDTAEIFLFDDESALTYALFRRLGDVVHVNYIPHGAIRAREKP